MFEPLIYIHISIHFKAKDTNSKLENKVKVLVFK